jgi:hypothetical protein
MLDDHRQIFFFPESYDPFHFRGMYLNAGQTGQLVLMIKDSEKKRIIQDIGNEKPVISPK